MVQILEPGTSFGSELGKNLGAGLGRGFSSGIEQGMQRRGLRSQANQFQQQTGLDISGYSPEMQGEFIKAFAKTEAKKSLLDQIRGGSPGKEAFQSSEAGRQSEGSDFGDLSDEQLLQLSAVDPNIARTAIETRKMKEKRRSEIGKQHFELSKDTLKTTNKLAEDLPQRELALGNMENALLEGDLSFFSPDNLADVLGVEGLRSPEGAAFKTAGKEFFIGNLGRVGARGLNQWLERQISDMMPKMGRSREANLVVTEALRTEMDVQRKQIELTNDLADKFEADLGYVPRDLAAKVSKMLQPYAVEKQKELKSKIEDIKEKYEPKNKEGVLMYDPTGNLRRVGHKDIKAAKSAGYRIKS